MLYKKSTTSGVWASAADAFDVARLRRCLARDEEQTGERASRWSADSGLHEGRTDTVACIACSDWTDSRVRAATVYAVMLSQSGKRWIVSLCVCLFVCLSHYCCCCSSSCSSCSSDVTVSHFPLCHMQRRSQEFATGEGDKTEGLGTVFRPHGLQKRPDGSGGAEDMLNILTHEGRKMLNVCANVLFYWLVITP